MKFYWLRLIFVIVLVGIAGVRVEATEPDEAQRRAAVRRALAWLVKSIEPGDWDKFEEIDHGVGQRKVATLLTAVLLEANADFVEFDAQTRRRFREKADQLHEIGKKFSSTSYSNWIRGFAALYAYDRSLRDGKPHPALEPIVHGFLERQNKDGSWGHGNHNLPLLYPRNSLMVVTNLALFAFGAAEREGIPVCKEDKYKKALSKALKMLHAAQASDGSMPCGSVDYGGGEAKRDRAGRTTVTLMALAALRQTEGDLFRRAGLFAQRNMAAIPHGHGGPAVAVALGAWGYYILSDDLWKQYCSQILSQILKCQTKDGSFSKASIAALGVEDENPTGYITACCAVGLSIDRTAVARKLRLNPPFKGEK